MLKRVLVAVVAVPLIILLILFAPDWTFALFVAFITCFASWELLHATAKLPLRLYLYTSACAALIPFGFLVGQWFGTYTLCLLAFLLMVLVFGYAVLNYGTPRAVPYETVLKCMFSGAVMPAFLSALVVLRGYGASGHGRMYVMMTIGLAFITDGGAYFAGVLLGKHRGITRVSPNKSLEGYIGGLVTGVVFTVVFGLVMQFAKGYEVNYLSLVFTGVLGAFVTEVGDLAFSLIKREYGVKDYGNLLPGHGGMMDRFDSMVFCAPLVMLIFLNYPGF